MQRITSKDNEYIKHLKKLKDLWCGGDAVPENLVEHFDEILKKYTQEQQLVLNRNK